MNMTDLVKNMTGVRLEVDLNSLNDWRRLRAKVTGGGANTA
jgi:hypothetical protein